MGGAKRLHCDEGSFSVADLPVSSFPTAVSPPISSSSSSTTLFTSSLSSRSRKSSGTPSVQTTTWIGQGDLPPVLAKKQPPQQEEDTNSESFVDGMKRILGNLHIKGLSAEKLHRGKTRAQDAPFATCVALQVHEAPPNVVIVGTGFAGFSAAIACARQGFSVVLLEKGSGLSPHGDLISFCPNANRILRRWGLSDLMWERSCLGGKMYINDSDGQPIRNVDMDDLTKKFGSPMYQGHRAQYLGVFGVEARMLGVEVVPFTQVVDILDNLDRPACITSDGRVFHGDVVLVADGCNSTLRETVFGTTAKETCTGYGIHRSITKVTPAFRNDPLCSHLLDGNVRVWLGDDCHAFFAPLDGGRQMSLSITHKDINKTASFNWKDVKSMNEVHPFVHGWDKTFLAALKYFHTGLHWRLFHHEEMPSWTSANGRVAFLGDAIHTYLPTSFQGATASVEDGACLGLCLALAGGQATTVPLALRVYEKLRKGPVKRKAEIGAHQRTLWHRYTETKNIDDAQLCSREFFGDDVEVQTLQEFETLAKSVMMRFRMDGRTFVKATDRAGF